MGTNDTETSPDLREKTDESLKDERGKTDEIIIRKSKKAEDKTIDTIRVNRLAADADRETFRAETAIDEAEDRHADTGVQPSQLGDERLILERERSDNAQSVERETEDRARENERVEKRLISDAVLERERKETDRNLLEERGRLDLEAAHTSALLTHEKASHGRTKTALVTRDQYIGILSHDLGNPLAAISIATRLMRKGLSNDTVDTVSLLGNLGIIEQGAAFMNRMISDLLDVERMANSKLILSPERVEVRALFQECVGLFAPIVSNKSFSMTVTCPEGLVADIDHDRILQVLSNLIGNALKFSPQGSTIELGARKQDNKAEISISDNGPGIPKDKMKHIFKKFSQIKTNDRHGLGLGLFISKSIVEAHKGQIWVTSGPGKGSTFRVTLPLTSSLSQPPSNSP
ncbi:MAG: hypothetical protein HXY51_08930 [Nitrospirae bacterium]|nr:hypothetical protein [Nitrospirota bacterium]